MKQNLAICKKKTLAYNITTQKCGSIVRQITRRTLIPSIIIHTIYTLTSLKLMINEIAYRAHTRALVLTP